MTHLQNQHKQFLVVSISPRAKTWVQGRGRRLRRRRRCWGWSGRCSWGSRQLFASRSCWGLAKSVWRMDDLWPCWILWCRSRRPSPVMRIVIVVHLAYLLTRLTCNFKQSKRTNFIVWLWRRKLFHTRQTLLFMHWFFFLSSDKDTLDLFWRPFLTGTPDIYFRQHALPFSNHRTLSRE